MSHFTTLVIGDDVEEQLAPFDENLDVPEYEDPVDVNKELSDALNYFSATTEHLAGRTADDLTIDEKVDVLVKWSGDGWRVVDGEIKRMTTYNPNSKWDWYTIGGRWNGFFRLKGGEVGLPVVPHYSELSNPPDRAGFTDQARKGQIDFARMREDARAGAEAAFDELVSNTDGIEPPHELYRAVRQATGDALQELRDELWQHPWMQAASRSSSIFGNPYEDFRIGADGPRENYVEARVAAVGATYAIVLNGEWISRGDMGWFGLSNDTVSEDDWYAKVREILDGLPDDALLTLVDCHI